MLEVMEDPSNTTKQVKQWTAKDKILSQVLVWCLKGWPTEVEAVYKPYSQRKLELSVKHGCVLWGARVVVPQKSREAILKQLHHTHLGISRMKGLARHMSGGQGWTPKLKKKCNPAIHVKKAEILQQEHRYIHGRHPGADCTWITPAPF